MKNNLQLKPFLALSEGYQQLCISSGFRGGTGRDDV
jgi:hypothetical protein